MLRTRFLLVLALCAGLAVAIPSPPTSAFKPYTHAVVGNTALADAVDDGRVTIAGRSYAVRPRVVAALRAWPSYFRAGTIGPDGFPDLTYGQSAIHPERTGAWLRYLFRQAWAAQRDPAWSEAERGQILAFTYGFLSHAGSDLWAHTLVNDFAGGVFPDAPEIATSVPKAAIALRHVIVEGYVGDATPGFDGNPERTTLADGDVSDDSTPGLAMHAPTRWLHRTLVDPWQPLPTAGCGNGKDEDEDGVADDGCAGNHPYRRGDAEQSRGPLVDFFLDLHSDLQLRMELVHADKKFRNCLLADPDCYKRQKKVVVDTVRGRRHGEVAVQACIGARFGCLASPGDIAGDNVTKPLVEKYLKHWIEDIDAGLKAWGQLGLVTTRALFDPQARRNLQNAECSEYAESDAAREVCEAGVGVTDVVVDQTRWFVNHHLISMLGAPDATGAALEALHWISKFLDSVLGKALNPLRVPLEELKKKARELILKEVKRVVGIDVELLDHMIKNPSVWMETEQVQVQLPGMGMQTVKLFPRGTRERLDAILGLGPGDRRTTSVRMPDGSWRTVGVLNDAAVARNAAPIDNAVTTSKLLLLDGDGLNRVIADNLVALGVTKPGVVAQVYGDGGLAPANVMIDQLRGDEPWLRLIDGDHVWRQDGQPRFSGSHGHGGEGTFPLWESCLARPVFGGALFRDWENGADMFPALGDDTSPDPADRAAPAGRIVVDAPKYKRPGKGPKVPSRLFVGAGLLQLHATDDVFVDDRVGQRARIQVGSGFSTRVFGAYGELPIADTDGAEDGGRTVTLSTSDPCNTLTQRAKLSLTVDTRDPVVSINRPAENRVVDTATDLVLAWDAQDPGGRDLASGVDESRSVGTVAGSFAENGGAVNTFGLAPGEHFVEVTARDRVDNAGVAYRPFEVQATSASLLVNAGQAATRQVYGGEELRVGLEERLRLAADRHTAGDHPAERDALAQARDYLAAHRDSGMSAWFVDLMTVHIDDLLARHVG